jgi:hypothetical protein
MKKTRKVRPYRGPDCMLVGIALCCIGGVRLQKYNGSQQQSFNKGACRTARQCLTAFTFQIFSAYSDIARSLENLPMPATFRIDCFVHSSGSR